MGKLNNKLYNVCMSKTNTTNYQITDSFISLFITYYIHKLVKYIWLLEESRVFNPVYSTSEGVPKIIKDMCHFNEGDFFRGKTNRVIIRAGTI